MYGHATGKLHLDHFRGLSGHQTIWFFSVLLSDIQFPLLHTPKSCPKKDFSLFSFSSILQQFEELVAPVTEPYINVTKKGVSALSHFKWLCKSGPLRSQICCTEVEDGVGPYPAGRISVSCSHYKMSISMWLQDKGPFITLQSAAKGSRVPPEKCLRLNPSEKVFSRCSRLLRRVMELGAALGSFWVRYGGKHLVMRRSGSSKSGFGPQCSCVRKGRVESAELSRIGLPTLTG
ncbi:uncharacterized protein LOC116791145 [Chiroxiphia lanceolata]|uniref:uncharacterized protein LOC116791145 n=1 Tax=Chiroxiphia lanceolata TaxID=296741 RepID=UPI0013CEB365|nr:uncharacterized protein LOC116791145 [Chiroxiphia lanceolata]